LNPDIASIGLDEKEAIQEGFNIDVVKYSYSYLKRHVIEMAQKGLIKKQRLWRGGLRLVNVLKGVTARRLRQEFPQTKEFLCGDSFWSDSYFIASTGQVSLDILMQYVESQMEK